MHGRLMVTAAAMLLATGVGAQEAPPPPEASIIVKYKITLPRDPARPLPGIEALEVKRFDGLVRGLHGLTFGNAQLAEMAAEALRRSPLVEYVEENGTVEHQAVPNDPQFSSTWGLDNTGQTGGTADADIDGPEGWDTTVGGTDTVVFVLDTGADLDHPDLAGNLWTNPTSIGGPHGFDAVNNDNVPDDDHWHGTHVSGTIAAQGNNSRDVAGVAWQARLGICKMLNQNGFGTDLQILGCLSYVGQLKDAGVPVTTINASWGSSQPSQAISDAIAALGAKDILFVAAAGNNNTSNTFYPASYPLPNILSVAASDHNDNRATFSNYGVPHVDVAAPGVNILSLAMGGGTRSAQGTSMAAPHVTGAAYLIREHTPGLTVADAIARICDTVDVLAQWNGVVTCGGRLNLPGAVGEPQPGIRLSMQPGLLEINQGGLGLYDVAASGTGGYSGNVSLSVDVPAGVSAEFDDNPIATGSSTPLDVAVSLGAPVGCGAVVVSGVSGPHDAEASSQLCVDPFGTVTDAYGNTTPVTIPTGVANGTVVAESLISVPKGYDIGRVAVGWNVNQTIQYKSMRFDLVAPDGSVTLLYQTPMLRPFPPIVGNTQIETLLDGPMPAGTWRFRVTKFNPFFRPQPGTINSWSLSIKGVPA